MGTPSGIPDEAAGVETLSPADATDGASLHPIDGRTMRRRRNRDAVITALIDLVNDGDLDPTIAKIADRAHVSERSIFRYFTDLNDLARTAIEQEMRAVIPLGLTSDPEPGTPLEDRVDELIASRMRVISRAWRLSRAARLKSQSIPEIDRGLANGVQIGLDKLNRLFEPELSRLDETQRDLLAVALIAALSFDAYDVQRRLLEREDHEIAAGWRLMLLRTLGCEPPASDPGR